jgi:DNA-binding beta-propeller fold protein YncE
MNLKNILKVLLLIFLVQENASAQQSTKALELPESIVSNGDRYFVSDQGKDAFSKDGDGFISEIDSKGNVIMLKFLPLAEDTLNTPKGLAVIKDVLYVADLDRVVGFNINTRKQVFEISIPGAQLLNDLCKIDDTSIAVTESVKDKVYAINIPSKSFSVVGSITAPNGVTYNAKTKKLYVCTIGEKFNGNGKLYEIDLANKAGIFKELLNSPTGFFDGIEFMDDENLIISDWIKLDLKATTGRFWLYNLTTHKAQEISFEQSPADIFYDKTSAKIYIPQSLKNRVVVTSVHQLMEKEKRNDISRKSE